MDHLPDWLSTTLASDAAQGRGVLPESIKPLKAGSRVVGRAFVVRAAENDNLAVVQAVAAPPPPGSVLVVSGHSNSRAATVGGLYALELQNLGVVGLVTDGLIRDAQEIRDLHLQVWCRGATPLAPAKNGPASAGGAVVLGSALVRDGDWVIADDDGVVVWPREDGEALLERAQTRLDSDNVRLARLQAVTRGG